jgi:hypothetical protein
MGHPFCFAAGRRARATATAKDGPLDLRAFSVLL